VHETRPGIPALPADRYVIERELGRGGMAIVWLARDLKHGRLVAVKVLHPELAATLGPERFLREIQVTAQLQHPHILPVYDSGESTGQLWYTMPYIEGESLRERLRREGQLPIGHTLRILREVAEALAYAHGRGIVHRDIKPENLLLTAGQALLADFGIARALDAPINERLTATGLVIGTPAYMSPEQASGEASFDQRGDLYALGVVAYEMLTGQPPLRGRSLQALIAAHLVEAPEPIRELRPDTPPALERLIMRLLAKTPGERPQSAEDVVRELERASAESVRSSTALVPTRLRHPPVPRRIAVPLIGAAILVVAPALVYRMHGRSPPSLAGASEQAIAVLPFVNMSPDKENEYFSDGMTEELIGALSKAGGLRVAARTSSFVFKGRNQDVGEIGRKLHVGVVVEGSVRKEGNRLRVSAQLINTGDGYHLWSETYDRELRDVFAVQDELARSIARALQAKLEPAQPQATSSVGAEDLGAYDLYLRGRYAASKRTPSGFAEALRDLEGAVAQNPRFARAYASLAQVYWIAPGFGVISQIVAQTRARAAAERALALDSTLAEAHTALASVLMRDLDWSAAEREFRRAIALAPNDADARFFHSRYLLAMGRLTESTRELEQAAQLDPLSLIIGSQLAVGYHLTGRHELALAQFRRTLDLNPQFPLTHLGLGLILAYQGDSAAALPELREGVRLSGRLPLAVGWLAIVLGRFGNRRQARELIGELKQVPDTAGDRELPLALAYLGLGQNDSALTYLERGAERHDFTLAINLVSPYLDPIRNDPRFARVRRLLRLPEEQAHTTG
jgi:TolB-like protein/Tfp pilus assembly protein PilF